MKLSTSLWVGTFMFLLTIARSFVSRGGIVARGGHKATTRMMASSTVRSMNVAEFGDIVKDESVRSMYQIVDVREEGELAASKIQGGDILHLPLSTAGEWTKDIATGKLLDPAKPTLCLCRAGRRSMQLAQFLIQQEFEEVYNIEGGMLSYYADVDRSVGPP